MPTILKDKIATINISQSEKELKYLFIDEVDSGIFKKKFNLSGKVISSKIIEIYFHHLFVNFKPSFGPLVKLNLHFETSDRSMESKIGVYRVNGLTSNVQIYGVLIICLLAFIASCYMYITDKTTILELISFPLFGAIYISTIYFGSNYMTSMLMSRVKKVLKTNNVKFVVHK